MKSENLLILAAAGIGLGALVWYVAQQNGNGNGNGTVGAKLTNFTITQVGG